MAEQIKFGDRLFLRGEKVFLDNGNTDAVLESRSGNLVIKGNLTVDGTTTTVNSTTVSIADPVFEIGDDSSDDNLDRGIKFKYNSSGAKVGFFGYDDSAGVFTVINDATDSSSVFSGSAGAVKFGAIEGSSFSDGTISGITFVDEDNMASDSATSLATQQSIKAYVDTQLTAEDLDFQADSGGALSIDLDSETLTFTGGTGIDTSGSGNAVTFAIDSTVTTLTGSQTLTNKTLTTPIIAEIDSGADITLDATADIILDAGGANIIFKDDGTSILDIANNSSDVELTVSTADKNFAIKGTDGSSAITALDIDMALNGKATFSGDVVVSGDLTVTGDDITMGTNTSGHIMVADGANFNPVAVVGGRDHQ